MAERRGLSIPRLLCAGPGRLTQALGLSLAENGLPLDSPPFRLNPRETDHPILAGPRIGITRAADTPWRFGLEGSPYLSRSFPKGQYPSRPSSGQ
jgi:DNA-3-methyladenine glycosylase